MLVTVSLLNTVSSCQFFSMVWAAFLTIFFQPSVFAFTYLAEHLSNMLMCSSVSTISGLDMRFSFNSGP